MLLYLKFHLGKRHALTNAPKTFQQQWPDQYFSDVTLATGDNKHIKAHKIILTLSSSFFKNIFHKYPHQKPLIYLKDIQHKYLDRVIEFIYKRQYDVKELDLVKFYSLGKVLGVNDILEEIDNKAANIII